MLMVRGGGAGGVKQWDGRSQSASPAVAMTTMHCITGSITSSGSECAHQRRAKLTRGTTVDVSIDQASAGATTNISVIDLAV
jgi:hypothetical protein